MTDLEQRCVEAGIKMTEQRRTIVRVLSESQDHPNVETLYNRAKEVDPSISIATVYRTLGLLDEMRLVQRHEFNERSARFEANIADHHHLVDIESGKVVEFQDPQFDELKSQIARQLGYDIVDVNLELYGRKKKS